MALVIASFIIPLLQAKQCSKNLKLLSYLAITKLTLYRYYYYPNFTDEKIKIQRG